MNVYALIAASIVLLLPLNTQADDYVGKPFTVGVGSYASIIAFDNPLREDFEFSGIALSFGYAISDNIAFRGTYFSLERDIASDHKSKGYDLLAHFGTGLATQGFKAYIGGGLFKDKWTKGTLSDTFSGLQLNGGIGYNWESVSLDFMIGARDSSDYETVLSQSVTAVSGNLLLSYRF